jgi:hypothetical protein
MSRSDCVCSTIHLQRISSSEGFQQFIGKLFSRSGRTLMAQRDFFWLHIKKSAGMTTRKLLQPYYTEVDRTNKPKTFIQASPEEYNDILNNYRVVLGEYQFKRCLFAKKYLYRDKWQDIYSFAFSREPSDRCVSMFHYLYWRNAGIIQTLASIFSISISQKKLICSPSYAFDTFLELVCDARSTDSIYHPISLHFTTHTAPMFDDITDFEGNVLLTKVYRLQALALGINEVFQVCGIPKSIDNKQPMINISSSRAHYRPTRLQIHKMQNIYRRDYEIYEHASH